MLLAAKSSSFFVFFDHDDDERTNERKANSPFSLFFTQLHDSTSALAVDIGSATSSTSSWEELVTSSDAQSYSEQYDRLFADLPLDVKKVRGRKRGGGGQGWCCCSDGRPSIIMVVALSRGAAERARPGLAAARSRAPAAPQS